MVRTASFCLVKTITRTLVTRITAGLEEFKVQLSEAPLVNCLTATSLMNLRIDRQASLETKVLVLQTHRFISNLKIKVRNLSRC